MARLEFLIEGEKVLSRNLRVLADGIKDMKDDFQKIGDLIEATAKENFENQGSETGSSWKKLAPSTIESRTKRRGYYKAAPRGASGKGPILTWTGKLKNSFTKQVGKLEVAVGNNADYYKYHQSKNRGNRKLPRRLILELKQKDKLEIQSILARGINRKIKNFGRQF